MNAAHLPPTEGVTMEQLLLDAYDDAAGMGFDMWDPATIYWRGVRDAACVAAGCTIEQLLTGDGAPDLGRPVKYRMVLDDDSEVGAFASTERVGIRNAAAYARAHPGTRVRLLDPEGTKVYATTLVNATSEEPA